MEFKYFVNEEEKTVVCVIDEDEQLTAIANEFRKATVSFLPDPRGWGFFELVGLMTKYDYHLTKSVGKAKCMPEDEFDVNVGKRIARRKALNKYYNKRRTIIELALKELNWLEWNFRFKITPPKK